MAGKQLYIAGIDTDVGKTVVSAILCRAFDADYWKPVQAGDLDNSDSIKLKKLVQPAKIHIHPEGYKLKDPMSPHAAAHRMGIEIDIDKIQIPKTPKSLIIEGAGGLMVPLNFSETNLDFIINKNLDVILVSKNYLGSINHTLLSLNLLKNNGITCKGVVFIGDVNIETEDIIIKLSKVVHLGNIPFSNNLNSEFISAQAEIFKIRNPDLL
ncbi:MAG: dethiobiotin synthetase [Sphingobacteriales bacterium]|jgi:dethiobiotin synthetase